MIAPSLTRVVNEVSKYLQSSNATSGYPYNVDEHHQDDVHVHPSYSKRDWNWDCVPKDLNWEKIDDGNQIE